MKKIILLACCAFILSGCHPKYLPPAPAPSDPASTKMAEAALSINDSLLTLEAIKKVRNPGYEKRLPDPANFCMNQIASLDWTGPIGPLVVKLAEAGHFRWRVLGTPPAIPVIVSITVRNVTLGEILRNADFQAREKAKIYVYPQSRLIELRYMKV